MTNRPPAEPRQWRPVIYSLLALVLPFLLLLIVAVAIAVISPALKDSMEKIITNYWALLALCFLQLLALDSVRRRCRWTWADVGFKRFGPRQRELLWQIPLYLAVIYGVGQLTSRELPAAFFSPEVMKKAALTKGYLLLFLPAITIFCYGFFQNFLRARWGAVVAVLTLPLLDLALSLKQFAPLALDIRLLLALEVFIGALCMTLLQERQRNLWAPLLALFINTLLSMLILLKEHL